MSQHVLTAETAREDGNTELEKEPKDELDGKSSSGVDKKPNLSSGEDTKKEDENGAKLAENPPNNYTELIGKLTRYGKIENRENAQSAVLITDKGNYSIYVKDIWNINFE